MSRYYQVLWKESTPKWRRKHANKKNQEKSRSWLQVQSNRSVRIVQKIQPIGWMKYRSVGMRLQLQIGIYWRFYSSLSLVADHFLLITTGGRFCLEIKWLGGYIIISKARHKRPIYNLSKACTKVLTTCPNGYYTIVNIQETLS